MAIVLAGSFNPAIFHPSWFARHGILRDSEADSAEVRVVTSQLAQFQMDWLEVQVQRERFMVISRNGGYEGPLRDLVISTFKRLEHTPLKALGMNREVHLRFDSNDRWHRFGHLLAPKEPWGDILKSPGLTALQMQGSGGSMPGHYINVAITNTGERRADIDLNDHRPAESPDTAASALMMLEDAWDDSQAIGQSVVEHLIKCAAR